MNGSLLPASLLNTILSEQCLCRGTVIVSFKLIGWLVYSTK